ncbi:hypothetical protein ACICHK_42460 (plasmid) [Streptomyces sp. AHU1]|uniref:hypothetical protein n=1 Tax=Streptomyces sp. AHU1 TaxID=3377215 RepID=UPI003877E260
MKAKEIVNIAKSVKRAVTAVSLGALTTGLVVCGTGSASAASVTPYKLTICSNGNYSSYAVLPQQGGVSTILVKPGKCASLSLASKTTTATVRGKWNTNSGTFYIDTVPVKASKGVLIRTYGTTTHHYLWSSI